MADQPLRLDQEDLYSPRVEAYLEERDALRRGIPDILPTPLILRIVYSSCFYMSVAGAAGALLAWAILEPFVHAAFLDMLRGRRELPLVVLFLFPAVAGGIGLFLGAVEGLMCRNPSRAFFSAMVGLGVGFGAGLVSIFAGGMLYAIMVRLTFEIDPRPPGQVPRGFAFLVQMMGRAMAWGVAASTAGLGQGIALGQRKVILNGLLGGILGGIVGGLLFDPIALLFSEVDSTGGLSRGIGFGVIGFSVGLFIGLVEQWTKTAWLLMKAGPLAGKQFVIYRNPTVLGSSPKADIYLFKDGAIEPRHALIHNRGGRFEIEDCDTPDGTYVNGVAIRSHILQPGDQIVLGKTVLEFSLREVK